jgi:hypothetical protein
MKIEKEGAMGPRAYFMQNGVFMEISFQVLTVNEGIKAHYRIKVKYYFVPWFGSGLSRHFTQGAPDIRRGAG